MWNLACLSPVCHECPSTVSLLRSICTFFRDSMKTSILCNSLAKGMTIPNCSLGSHLQLLFHTLYAFFASFSTSHTSFCAEYLQNSSSRLYTHTHIRTYVHTYISPQKTHSCSAKQWDYTPPHCYDMLWAFRILQRESFYHGVRRRRKRSIPPKPLWLLFEYI